MSCRPSGILHWRRSTAARSTGSTQSCWRRVGRTNASGGLSAALRPIRLHHHASRLKGRREMGEAQPQSSRCRRPTPRQRDRASGLGGLDSRPAARLPDRDRQARHGTGYLLLATTGLRRGEALGLRWCDVDLEAGARLDPPDCDRDQAHADAGHTQDGSGTAHDHAGYRHHRCLARSPQAAGIGAVADGLGLDRQQLGLLPCGRHADPSGRFTRGFSDAVRRLGLPSIRLQDLRHGWATLALQAGVHPKVV
jgi:integrase